MGTVHEPFGQYQPLLFREVEHFFDMGHGDGHGFFAEDVFASVEGLDGPFIVHGIGEGDVNGFYGGIGEQGLIRVVSFGDLMGGGEWSGGGGLAGAHGYQRAALGGVEAGGELGGDAASAQDAPGETGGVAHRVLRKGEAVMIPPEGLLPSSAHGVCLLLWPAMVPPNQSSDGRDGRNEKDGGV